jgi:probable rRNA maturation factor
MVIVETKLADVTQTSLARFTATARKAARLRGDVNVLVTSSEELRRLNKRFRKKDKPTDVLSFPSAIEGFGGDIAISADIARENGETLGHGLGMELKILILHGILHLAGYDHEVDDGKMARAEVRLRERLGLSSGLIERSSVAGTARKGTSKRKKR